MLTTMVVVSVIFLVIVNIIARFSRAGLVFACSLSGLALGFGVCLGSSVLSLHALTLLVAGLICLCRETGHRRFLKWSLVATGLAYVIPVGYGIHTETEWARLQKVYPIESMDERLGYETRPGREGLSPTTRASGPNLGHLAEQEEQIEQQERQFRTQVRVVSLQHLHSSNVKQFIDSEGFGVGRVIYRPRPEYVELREQPGTIALPPPEYTPQEYVDPLTGNRPEKAPTDVEQSPGAPDTPDLLALHDEGLVDFANVSGFGYIQDRKRVVGFESHRFSTMPGLHDPKGKGKRWKIQQLELVSLLKHDEPVAYVSEHLPRMDKLRNVPTRPLDDFEAKALKQLEGGKDLEVEYTTDRIRMLGSIRALKQCVKCHHAERGELLGAFTYKLKRDGAQ